MKLKYYQILNYLHRKMLRKKLKLNEQQIEDTGNDIEIPEPKIGQAVSITFEMMFWEKIWRLEQQLCKFFCLQLKILKDPVRIKLESSSNALSIPLKFL